VATGRDKALEHLASVDFEFRTCRKAYRHESDRRKDAMVTAYTAGASIGEIAEALGIGHESVPKMIRHSGI